MIENACPYAPDAVKPESIPGPRNQSNILKKILNKKSALLIASLLALTVLYTRNYSSLHWEGSPVLFQDWYIVKLSLYSYLTGMITYFVRKYRKERK